MESSHHQILKPFLPADDHRFEFELYTIPGSSGWFSWDNIHEIEKASLKEFFDGTSFTRNPRVYKEYRDFIISKYREDPSRRLTFSEVRKSLMVIWLGRTRRQGGGRLRWRKGLLMGLGDFKMPPLSSHSDVYQELIELVCESCKERCESGHYEYTKDASSIICIKCFKNGTYGKNKSIDDFKFVDDNPDDGNRVAVWTEAETLLLLESVLKHGDDWDLVAQNVQTKSKPECISKLIQLPFGQLMLGSAYDRCRYRDTNSNINNQKRGQVGPPAPQETKDIRIQHIELESKAQSQQNGDADSEGPPPKRICIAPISDSSNSKMEQTDNEVEQVAPSLVVPEEIRENESQVCELKNHKQQDGDLDDHCPPKSDRSKPVPNVSNSLMRQVTRISAVVGPHVAASAAEAAITALCDENQIPKEIFDREENGNELRLSTQTTESDRIGQGNDSEMDARPNESEKSIIPLPLRMRATTATALGAAAAHAKLLAIQEDREVERLVSTIINTQLKKLQYKMELLKEVEAIMEKELSEMAEVEESVVGERMEVVQKVMDAGLSRWRDGHGSTMVNAKPPHPQPQPQVEIML
ncbi:SWI/SNF complex subunit SWI3A isoform X2 [Cynara cardunculus var. scolymus]|uniref:SWI/SNF complex subunit SWI3A isoform X2 n=1 Tax=Cynara cardunculus var. scolymus TaxID=59895 RepID=UPI000D6281A4|nr:SWI/SNF complex subunit SWI3A isoform X2 [Cynara cardunculus var. scolymus]